jgi:diaminopimelate epimerase
MQQILFCKYSASGNDFILIDNRQDLTKKYSVSTIEKLCHRKLGIGADGLVLVEKSKKYDFKMIYFNNDGLEAEMCGNGARSLIHFVHHVLKLKDIPQYEFETKNAVYQGTVKDDLVFLKMNEIKDKNKKKLSFSHDFNNAFYINTGVPHVVLEVDDIQTIDVNQLGRVLRNHSDLKPEGANINFIQKLADQKIKIRTYERGVEAETLSCGTGVTAAAMACQQFYNWQNKVEIEALGGFLTVTFNQDHSEVFFSGEVQKTFSGYFASKHFC